jgi:hypothetical protein
MWTQCEGVAFGLADLVEDPSSKTSRSRLGSSAAAAVVLVTVLQLRPLVGSAILPAHGTSAGGNRYHYPPSIP